MKETGTAVTGEEALALMHENALQRFFHPLLATTTKGEQYVSLFIYRGCVEAFQFQVSRRTVRLQDNTTARKTKHRSQQVRHSVRHMWLCSPVSKT